MPKPIPVKRRPFWAKPYQDTCQFNRATLQMYFEERRRPEIGEPAKVMGELETFPDLDSYEMALRWERYVAQDIPLTVIEYQ